MKKYCFLFLFLISLTTYAQKIDERPVTVQVGECITKTTHLISRNDKSLKEFVVDVPQDGNYYLDVLLLVSGTSAYEVLIDEKNTVGSFKNSVNSWQFLSLLNSTGEPQSIPLTKGQHTVSFSVSKPFVPLIDVIALNRNNSRTALDQKMTNDYLTKLRSTKLPTNYEASKKSGKSNKRILANPEGQYLHEIDYTYNTTSTFQYWLEAGLPYVFKTQDTNTDPVLYVFYANNPAQGSWSDDDSGGNLNSQISCTPSVSGYYTFFFKTYGFSSAGIADFYFNELKTMDDIPISGNWYNIPAKSGELNYFTSHVSGATNILIADQEISPIRAFNGLYYPWYQYSGYQNQYSRIRGNFNGSITKVIPTTCNMYNPSGTCDLYMNCEMVNNSNMFIAYPNLGTDDALKTANSTSGTGAYNCYAWAAGISPNGNVSPGSYSWNYPPNEVIAGYPADDTPLGSMDDFLGNNPPRYAGAWSYTRSGADANNATIALWATTYYTHLSIRKPGNDHPHGYDWESKMSGDERIMHPKNAIAGNQLGQIVAYYRVASSGGRLSAENGRMGGTEGISLQESLDRGLSVMEDQKWLVTELDLLEKLTKSVAPSLQAEFSGVYQRWVERARMPAIRITADQQSHQKLTEYAELKNWIKQHGTATVPLLFNEFFNEPTYAIEAILGLTRDTYGSLWKEVSVENTKNLYDEKGRYLVRSQSTNCARYIQKILKGLTTSNIAQVELLCSPNPASAGTTFEFYLPVATAVSLQIVSERGQIVGTLLENKAMTAGWQSIFWDGKTLENTKALIGVYTGVLMAEGQRKTIQIVVN